MPTLTPALITTLTLPGYCNHVHELHDGQTRYLLADIEEYGTKRSTVQLYRLNYYKEPDEWELLWDLTKNQTWDPAHKPALGHSLCLGPKSLIVSVPWKGTGAADGTSGEVSYAFLRDQIPLMEGQTSTQAALQQSGGTGDQATIAALTTEVHALRAYVDDIIARMGQAGAVLAGG